jgi:tRNA A-37 threonylcarbamoyl transferase component Bud32
MFNVQKARELTLKALEKLRESRYYRQDIVDVIINRLEININTRARVKAGSAEVKGCAIKCLTYQTRLLTMTKIAVEYSGYVLNNMTELEQYQTVAHETAHIYQALLSGIMSHDAEFYAIDIAMGGEGTRCHKAFHAVKRNKRTRYVYFDTKENKELQFRRGAHARIQARPMSYARYVFRQQVTI